MPPLTRLLAIRHAQTSWNASGRIQGQQDIPLDALGLRQADALAHALQDEPLQAIYSSDLERACRTAEPLCRGRGLAPTTDPGLRERAFGSYEGLSFVDIEQRWPEQALRWRRREADFSPGGGESLTAFRQRVVEATTRLAAAHLGQSIALVAHGGVLDILYRTAVRLDLAAPRTWALDNAAISRLLYSAEGFVVVGWNDHAHLDAL